MTSERLFGTQRQERLLAELRGRGAVRVRDLARELGVSELTIRRDIAALAARGLVSKVHGGATLPAHRPAVGQPRRASLRYTIGMVVPSLDFYWPAVVAGARAAAAALGVSIQLRGSSYDPDEDHRQVSKLVEAGEVQGLLLAPALAPGGALPEWLCRLAVPAVLLEREPHGWSGAEWVRTDHAHGLGLAVRHLCQQGHRRIGLVLARESPTAIHLRRAWQAIPAGSAELVTPEREPGDGLLDECRRAGITALVVHSDPEAGSVAQRFAERGVAIPGELAVVSYDDETAHLAEPALTAVRPPKSHLGRLAVELMVARLAGGAQRPAHRVLLAPDLVVRASSVRL